MSDQRKLIVNEAEFNAIMAACETDAMREHLAAMMEVIPKKNPYVREQIRERLNESIKHLPWTVNQ